MKKIGAALVAIPACALALMGQAAQPRFTELAKLPPIDAGSIAVSPNGRLIMVSDGHGLHVLDRSTSATTQVATGQFDDVSWSPRGDRLVFYRDGENPEDTPIWTVAVDPSTGKLTGPARRVTDRSGDTPVFSPDGREIAFAMDSDRPRGQDLAIIPAAGGPARSVYQSTGGVMSISWSPDGKSIFFETDVAGRHGLLRIAAAGGTPEALSRDGEAWPGVDPTGRWFLQATDSNGYGVRATDGRALPGTVPLPPDLGTRVWAPDGRSQIALKVVRSSKLMLLPLTGGSAKALTAGLPGDNSPSWSPDGKRIAVVRSGEGRTWLVVLSSEGTVQAEYKNVPEPTPSPAVWSQDGQRLVYASREGTAVAVLDVATAVAKDIATRQSGVTSYHWVDAATVRYFTWIDGGSERHGAIKDASMTGEPRLVRDLGAQSVVAGGLVHGNVVVVGTSVGKPQLVDLSSGKARPLGSGRGLAPDLSPDGKHVLLPTRGAPSAFRIYDIDRGSTRTVPLPFSMFFPANRALWHPDGRHVIVAGMSPGADRARIFLVPVNGEAVTTLATMARAQRVVAYAVAPDGKSLVYAEDGPPTTSIGALSFDDILPRSTTPAARRP